MTDQLLFVRRCSKCGVSKDLGCFTVDRARTDGLKQWCRDCCAYNNAQWAAARRDHRKSYRRRRTVAAYGLTTDEHAQMLKSQGGVCALCKSTCRTGKALAVDHDHATGKVRGLLCSSCNLGIGKLKDSPDIIAAALMYLLDHGRALTTDALMRRLDTLPNLEAHHVHLQRTRD